MILVTQSGPIELEALVRDLKDKAQIQGSNVDSDETAMLLLVGWEEGTGYCDTLTDDDLDSFIDQYLEAWRQE